MTEYTLASVLCRGVPAPVRARLCALSRTFCSAALEIGSESPIYKKYLSYMQPCARCGGVSVREPHTCGLTLCCNMIWNMPVISLSFAKYQELFADYHTFVRVMSVCIRGKSNPCRLKHVAGGCVEVMQLLVRRGSNDYTAAMVRATVRMNTPIVRYLGELHLVSRGGLIQRTVYEDAIVRYIYADDLDTVQLLVNNDWERAHDLFCRVQRAARIISKRIQVYLITLIDTHRPRG